jgi:hypothetical protein
MVSPYDYDQFLLLIIAKQYSTRTGVQFLQDKRDGASLVI